MPAASSHDPRDKELGAYYTESRVAAALCRWAMQGRRGTVLDPSFGGGVFLDAAAERAELLGEWDLFGVEIDHRAHLRASRTPRNDSRRLIRQDFFAVAARDLPPVDAVIGNPPFIRFQRFTGEARARAVQRSAEAGLRLDPLAGSWVAFIAHAMSFLGPGGRMALVVPAELGHAPYARSLLALLQRSFASTTFVTTRSPLFPYLDQDTLLLLAGEKGAGPGSFSLLELGGAADLELPLPPSGPVSLDAQALTAGRASLLRFLLPEAALSLYAALADSADAPSREPPVVRLGDVARVESGYVTGSNAHFHLTPCEAREAGLPRQALLRAVFRSRAVRGLAFTEDDWNLASGDGAAGYLAQTAGHEEDPEVAAFLARLRSAGVHLRYKTRTRAPWYRIARVSAPPLFLTAMAGERTQLTENRCGAVVPNTFHTVTPLGSRSPSPAGLTVSWLTSLARLSAELEGHSLGGGMLKLDPGEARQVLLPAPVPLPADATERIDGMLRAGLEDEARSEADRLLLECASGLGKSEAEVIRAAVEELRERRHRR